MSRTIIPSNAILPNVMVTVLGVFKTLIKYESKVENVISNQGKIISIMNQQALIIIEKNLLLKTNQTQEYNFIGVNKQN